jgi:hypothetical protein
VVAVLPNPFPALATPPKLQPQPGAEVGAGQHGVQRQTGEGEDERKRLEH